MFRENEIHITFMLRSVPRGAILFFKRVIFSFYLFAASRIAGSGRLPACLLSDVGLIYWQEEPELFMRRQA